MTREAISDLVIVLPGIMGSVLQKNGKDLWVPSINAVVNAFLRQSLANDLPLVGDDPALDDIGDGVQATDVMPDVHLIPGLWKIDGYTGLLRFLTQTFELSEGRVATPDPRANLFGFPYDWRRDNRASARRLKHFIDRQLPAWRAASGASDARVILLGHSMGGLVARYYLEVLGGWEHCRALLTFGTPFRGAPKALDFLANGSRKIPFVDVTAAVRSFPSVYQLVPNYQVVKVGRATRRLDQIAAPPHLRPEYLAWAQEFHGAIAQAVEARRGGPQRPDGYPIFPVVGVQQPTAQSLTLDEGQLALSEQLPPALKRGRIASTGDSTVPYFSAIPTELGRTAQPITVIQSHGALQLHPQVHTQLQFLIGQLLSLDWETIEAPLDATPKGEPPAISLAVDDLYLSHEPVVLRAQLRNVPAPQAMQARVTPADRPSAATTHELRQVDDDTWQLTVEGLPPGVYRVLARTFSIGPGTPGPVEELFEVV